MNDEGLIFIPNASALKVHKELIPITYESTEASARNAENPELTIHSSIVSDLGNHPTFLTSKGKEKARFILQGTKSILNRPDEHERGPNQPPKKAKQKWIVKAINSLRLKPFCCDIDELAMDNDGRKGPKSYC